MEEISKFRLNWIDMSQNSRATELKPRVTMGVRLAWSSSSSLIRSAKALWTFICEHAIEPFGFINPCKSGGDSYFGCTSAKHIHYHIRFLSAYSFTACLCVDWKESTQQLIFSTVSVTSSHMLQFYSDVTFSHAIFRCLINQIYAKWPFLHAHVVIYIKISKHHMMWNI